VNDQLKVLFISDKIEGGGAEKLILDLAVELIQSSRIHVTILSLNKPQKYPIYSQVPVVYPNKTLGFYNFWNYSALFKQIQKFNPDIIHSNLLLSDWIIGWFKIIHKKKIVISTIHGYYQERSHEIRLKHKLHFFIQGILYRKYNSIVCVSQHVKQYFCKSYSVNTNKCKIIYNALSNINSYPVFNVNAKFAGKLLFVGSLRAVKNLHLLINVLKLLPDYFTLTIIGDGDLREELESQADSLNLTKRVIFLGYQPNAYMEIAEYNILIVPSLRESFSLIALEGLSIGIPVIASKVGGINEIFKAELKSLLFNPNDIEELKQKVLDVESKYSFFVNEFSRYRFSYLDYSIQSLAGKYLEVYRKYKNDIMA